MYEALKMRLNLYEIRLCKKEEYEKLMRFIRDYWSEKHIFLKSKELFEFQHGKADNGFYDFLVAVHKETDEFHAVLGFINSSLYDGQSKEEPEFTAGAIWKVRDDVENKEIHKLGLGILFTLIQLYPKSLYITLGLSQYAQTIYDALHYHFSTMNHYYIANDSIEEFVIADKVIKQPQATDKSVEIKLENDASDALENQLVPNKTAEYVRNRYINHPFYHYDIYGIYVDYILKAEWVVREIEVNGAKCLRIVDMRGCSNVLHNCYGKVQALLKETGAEYLDCYNYGISKKDFEMMGFVEKRGDTVIPNYFEPFERKNVEIYCAHCGDGNVSIFKGDADQDRPNDLA